MKFVHALSRHMLLLVSFFALVVIFAPPPIARADPPDRRDKLVRNDGRSFEIQDSPLRYAPSKAVSIKPEQLKNQTVRHKKLGLLSPSPNSIIGNTGPQPESIIGADERVQVADTTVYPYSAIVELEVNFPLGSVLCSGFMIGPSRVATAAHCLYYGSFGGWAQSITAYPGRNGTNAPFGSVAATHWSVRDRWTRTQAPGIDYGVLELASPIGETVGYFGYYYNDRDNFFLGRSVTVSGYPGDKVESVADTQWMMSDTIDTLDNRRFFYSIDTFGGQSGSPMYGVWNKRDCNPCAFGIHTYGVGGGWNENSATRITKNVFNFLQSAGAQ